MKFAGSVFKMGGSSCVIERDSLIEAIDELRKVLRKTRNLLTFQIL